MKFFTEQRQQRLFADVKQHYRTHKYDRVHQLDHVLRVMWWTRYLAQKEKASMSVVMPAAILHDISRNKGKEKEHAKNGSIMCRSFLRRCSYKEDEIKMISDAIMTHSTHDVNSPKTKEAKIIFDADKLDATGPLSIERWFLWCGKDGRRDVESAKKAIEDIKEWKKMYGSTPFFTNAGKAAGKKPMAYVERFFMDVIGDGKKFEAMKGL
jgi:uncharacterized protein